MKRVQMRFVDWAVLFTSVGACLGTYRRRSTTTAAVASARRDYVLDVPMPADAIDSAAAHVLSRDVFGVGEDISAHLSGPQLSSSAPIVIPAGVFTPRLAIQGIAGPPWVAVLSGFAGQNTQTVVVAGDTVGRYRIRSISIDSVTVQSPDSLIRLSLKRIGS